MKELNIVDRIRWEVKRKGFSWESLAYELGMDYSATWRKCNGKVRLDVEFLQKLAGILGIEASYLIDGRTVAGEKLVVGEILSDIETKMLVLFRALSNEKKEQAIRVIRVL